MLAYVGVIIVAVIARDRIATAVTMIAHDRRTGRCCDRIMAGAGPMHRTGDLRLVVVMLSAAGVVLAVDRFCAGVLMLYAEIVTVPVVTALRLCAGGDEDDQPSGNGRREPGFKL